MHTQRPHFRLRLTTQLSLKQRLLAVAALLFSIAIAIAALSTYSLRANNGVIRSLNTMIRAIDRLNEASFKNTELMSAIAAGHRVYAKGKPLPAKEIERIKSQIDEIDLMLIQYSAEYELTPEQDAVYTKIWGKWEHAKSEFEKILQGYKSGEPTSEELKVLVDQVSKSALSLNADVSQSIKIVNQAGRSGYQDAAQRRKRNDGIFALVSLLGILIVAVSAWSIVQISRSFGILSENLRRIAELIVGATENVGLTGAQLSSMVRRQTADVAESVASVQEISSMIETSAKDAESTLDNAELAQKDASEGLNTVEQLRKTMEEISHASDELSGINELMREIEKKTNVIHEITFKTQLLSFNASIEAARAGQHGRGFAVVAEEVGALAKISGTAAHEIGKLLEKSLEQANHAIANVNTRIEAARSASQAAEQVFDRITQNITRLTPMVKAIQQGAKEQSIGVDKTNQAFIQIDIATKETSNSAKLLSEIAPKLNAQAEELNRMVDSLERLVFGHIRQNRPLVDSKAPEVSAPVSSA